MPAPLTTIGSLETFSPADTVTALGEPFEVMSALTPSTCCWACVTDATAALYPSLICW